MLILIKVILFYRSNEALTKVELSNEFQAKKASF